MNYEELLKTYKDGAKVAHQTLRRPTNPDLTSKFWWPEGRIESSILAFSVGIQWAKQIVEGQQHAMRISWEKPCRLCWPTGKRQPDAHQPTMKERLLENHGIQPHRAKNSHDNQRRTALLAHSPVENMLDLTVLPDPRPDAASTDRHCAILTMESETSPGQGVHRGDSRTKHSYGWDFFKLLWVQCPNRLFFAQVGNSGDDKAIDRIDALKKTLQMMVDDYPRAMVDGDVLVAILLPKEGTDWKYASCRIWQGGQPHSDDWKMLFGQERSSS